MALTELAEAYSATGVAWRDGPARIYDRMAEELVARSPVPLEGELVADVGAGTGAASRAVAAAGGTPVALDVALGMLTVDRAARPPAAVADARRLPLPAGSCGAVVAAFSYNHLRDPAGALREAARVVRSGGAILVSAYAADDLHPVKAAVDQAAGEAGWRPDPWVSSLRAAAMPQLATAAGAMEAATRAELRVDVERVDVAFPELGPAQLVAWRMGMAQVAPFLAARGAAVRQRVAERAMELLGDAPVLVRPMLVLTAVV